MSVTLIVVTYNSAGLVEAAIDSVVAAAAAAGIDLEVLVIDNASSDGSAHLVASRYPDAVVVRNETNLGFGRANNLAFERASGEYWLLLNPDATLEPAALGGLVRFLEEHSRAAAVAPTVEDPRGGGAESGGMAPGLRSLASHFLMLNRLLLGDRGGAWRGFQLARRPHLGPRSVDWLGGMAMLVRPDAIREVAGFDERIFLYGEDVDLGRRLRERGWHLWILPTARARHLIAGSQGRVSTRWVQALHDLYAARAHPMRIIGLDLIVAVGLSARAAAASIGGDRWHRRRMRAAARHALRSLGKSLLRRPR